jgi:hypothetical protein
VTNTAFVLYADGSHIRQSSQERELSSHKVIFLYYLEVNSLNQNFVEQLVFPGVHTIVPPTHFPPFILLLSLSL